MPSEVEIGPASELAPGTVKGAGPYAVGNASGERFAVTRRCRHFFADLARKLVDNLFAVRNAVDPADAYRAFRGRDAQIDALMRDRGFPVH